MSRVSLISARRPDAPLVITCEHASERLPDGWQWPEQDHWLLGTHWAYDPGAAELTGELAERSGGAAVLAGFSRLLVDPNRPPDSPSLFRDTAEGRAVHFNRAIDPAEREKRLACWRAYHDAVDRAVGESRAPLAFAVHTFTPEYEGERRSVEIGVLFDREEALAEELRARLAALGFDARLNEPYSGKQGLIYSVDRHATRHGRRALEIELRQDLAADATVRSRVADAVVAFAAIVRI